MTALVHSFEQHTAEGGWTYRSAGDGATVLVLDPAGEAAPLGPLEALTEYRRVVVPDLPESTDAKQLAEQLVDLLAGLGATSCSVVARGNAAEAALWLVGEHAELVDTLVLEAPEFNAALFAALPPIDTPTLVLLGQRTPAAAADRTGVFTELPGSTVALIYDAGADIRGERPSAYAAAVGDYLERGQAFVVNTRSSVING